MSIGIPIMVIRGPSVRVPPSVEFVTGVSLSTIRNDFTGSVGFKFTAAANFTITHLGRWVRSGNSQTHTVYLYQGATLLGSVSVNTVGAPAAAFLYVALASPISISNGTAYEVESAETGGGDIWYDGGNVLTTTAVGSITNASINAGGGTFGGANNSYVPVSFKYR